MSAMIKVSVSVCASVCVNSGGTKLTGDEKHDSCSKGAVEPFKGGEVGKGHDASDDACEARHP